MKTLLLFSFASASMLSGPLKATEAPDADQIIYLTCEGGLSLTVDMARGTVMTVQEANEQYRRGGTDVYDAAFTPSEVRFSKKTKNRFNIRMEYALSRSTLVLSTTFFDVVHPDGDKLADRKCEVAEEPAERTF